MEVSSSQHLKDRLDIIFKVSISLTKNANVMPPLINLLKKNVAS